MNRRLVLYFLFGFICLYTNKAQVSYSSAATYGLRKIIPTYSNSAIQVLRACDNATANIGFTSCGDLDTTTLKNFVIVPNPVSAITSSVGAAYGLRRLRCGATSAIQVRRSCDNATLNIGFTALGDLDTVGLKTFVMASNPLSAISAAAGAAFSLRKLRCAYAGSAIQVRRSSDNTTSNIGFTSVGDLDTTALKTFVGAGNNGFVTIWYDQSGNGNNAVQPTPGNQPEIVVAGNINRQNNQPAIILSTALASYLVMPYAAGSLNFSSASTTNGVFAKTALPTGDAAVFDQIYTPNNISVALSWNNGTGAYAPLSLGHFPSSSWQFAALPADVTTGVDNIITGTIKSGAANTTSINLFQNGTLSANAANLLTVGAIAAQPFNIGKDGM